MSWQALKTTSTRNSIGSQSITTTPTTRTPISFCAEKLMMAAILLLRVTTSPAAFESAPKSSRRWNSDRAAILKSHSSASPKSKKSALRREEQDEYAARSHAKAVAARSYSLAPARNWFSRLVGLGKPKGVTAPDDDELASVMREIAASQSKGSTKRRADHDEISALVAESLDVT